MWTDYFFFGVGLRGCVCERRPKCVCDVCVADMSVMNENVWSGLARSGLW